MSRDPSFHWLHQALVSFRSAIIVLVPLRFIVCLSSWIKHAIFFKRIVLYLGWCFVSKWFKVYRRIDRTIFTLLEWFKEWNRFLLFDNSLDLSLWFRLIDHSIVILIFLIRCHELISFNPNTIVGLCDTVDTWMIFSIWHVHIRGLDMVSRNFLSCVACSHELLWLLYLDFAVNC